MEEQPKGGAVHMRSSPEEEQPKGGAAQRRSSPEKEQPRGGAAQRRSSRTLGRKGVKKMKQKAISILVN